MPEFKEEKKIAPSDNPENAAARDNIIDLPVPKPNTEQPTVTEQKMSFCQKVRQNLYDYQRGWFDAIFFLDVMAVIIFPIFAKDPGLLVMSFGAFILTFISYIGINYSKIRLFTLNFITTTLLVICIVVFRRII
ncbi:hypothetical protein ENBRE01_1624 [Enteropsectra breve]|nr:hypothetical protein ENBRE01_1624 [Enteropsectra breve]